VNLIVQRWMVGAFSLIPLALVVLETLAHSSGTQIENVSCRYSLVTSPTWTSWFPGSGAFLFFTLHGYTWFWSKTQDDRRQTWPTLTYPELTWLCSIRLNRVFKISHQFWAKIPKIFIFLIFTWWSVILPFSGSYLNCPRMYHVNLIFTYNCIFLYFHYLISIWPSAN
jgi:hypothetical protein